ncbi:MAG: transglutaminase N-terminal domain-containing protein, partial [Blastocatellia bacterium]
MRLQIRHTTIFHYTEAINEAYTEMRLRPLEGAGQRCYRFSLMTEPRGEVMSYIDRYGNTVHHFDTLQSHDRVVVMAASDVETTPTYLSEP